MKFRDLTADDIEVRVQQATEKGASLLLYKTSRVDSAILDETVGPENWDCQFTEIGGNLFCSIGIYCVVADGHYEWVYKQDVGVPSNMEAEKGQASDALKRAAFRWGIGSELYTAPFIWVPAEKLKQLRRNDRTGKYQCYDKFHVQHVKVRYGRITELTIANNSNAVVWGNPFDALKAEKERERKPVEPKKRFARATELKAKALGLGIKEEGLQANNNP